MIYKCRKCKKEKDFSEFPKKRDLKFGIRKTCYICFRKIRKKWWKKTAPIRLEYAQKWYANNREKVIQQKVSGNLKLRRLARLDCIEHYSKGRNCCECCGEKNLEFLTIDHIKGGGNKHRKRLRKKYKTNLYMPTILKRLGYPSGYRILCYNCNSSLGHYGYCPHQKRV